MERGHTGRHINESDDMFSSRLATRELMLQSIQWIFAASSRKGVPLPSCLPATRFRRSNLKHGSCHAVVCIGIGRDAPGHPASDVSAAAATAAAAAAATAAIGAGMGGAAAFPHRVGGG